MFPPRLLELLDEPPRWTSAGDRLVRVAREVDAETPQRFLSRGDGLPRAFWQLGETWRAGLGEAAHVHVPPGEGAGRFDTVRERAQALSQDAIEDADDELDALDLIGGFSFHQTPDPDAAWDAFGAARFTVPALTLVHGPARTRLVGAARVPRDVDPDTALEHAREALDDAADRLKAPPPRGPMAYQIPSPVATDDRDRWTSVVEEALTRIDKGGFRKAVLARTLDLEAPEEPAPDPVVILGNLRQQNPGTHLFMLEPRPGHAFLGAAPELIAHVRGDTFQASAVAGSIARGDTEAEDDRLARKLAASSKDREEHGIVVRSMRRRLTGLADHVEVGRQTSILRLARIQHLERDLYAKLGPDAHVLDLLEALHPTPAVCGHPRETARDFLRRSEPFERGWYAGPVGWFDADGEGAFAPGLRSAVLDEDRWRLFAGAGIVEGSDPEAEFEETRIKFRPMLDALGVQEAPP